MTAVCAVLGFCLYGTPAAAYDDDDSRKTLSGIRQFLVTVEIVGIPAKAGADSAIMQTDAELRLRLAGIPVVSSPEDRDPPVAMLVVRAQAVPEPDGNYLAVELQVVVKQLVKIERVNTMGKRVLRDAIAETWSAGYVGLLGEDRLHRIRETIRDLTDRFVNAYLAANPKPAGAK